MKREAPPFQGRYLQAACAYAALGSVVMAITVASPGMLTAERRVDLAHLLAALPFFLAAGALIAWGHQWFAGLARLFGVGSEKAARMGAGVREKVVMLLTLSALGRVTVFAANALGWRLRLGGGAGGVSWESVPAKPRMFVAALLMIVIATLLARASWVPFLTRRRNRTQ
ncbi:MAG: hypothetical protein K0U98_22830 [Deltaproteobacteria bacterium]|nr:hypothetical protein [Deltaproteobacteria bacterium]